MNNIAQNLHTAKWQIMERYLANHRPWQYFCDHTHAVDLAIGTLWNKIFGTHSPLALLATGGYGRQELYPHSDVDLAIVSTDELTENQKNQIIIFTQQLWNLSLSPAIKSGSLKQLCDSAQTDLTADTAFLESRYLAGCLKTAQNFQTAIHIQRDNLSFIEGKLLEMQQRHAKQPALMLEPNIKNGAGGLRDIHTMMWLAKIQNLNSHFEQLKKDKIINQIESNLLRNSHRVLAQIRIELHLAAGREENRLIFDLQNTVAANLGYGDNAQQAMEQLMRQFYRASKHILQLNQIIIPMLRGRIYAYYPRITHEINEYYYHINHQIAAKNKQIFTQKPEHIFGIVQELQRHNDLHSIAPQTLRAWWNAVQNLNDDFYNNETHRIQFLQFFQIGTGITHTMRLLNLYGVLAKYLPDWDKIVGLLQHDLFHIYPVDDHILMVLRNIRRLAIDTHSHEFPFASSLMQGFDKKYVLYLATIFHDIAKGRNGDHAKLGVADAKRFAADHKLPENDGELLAWLVEYHLLFSIVAQKQDIHDPEVIEKFCQIVDSTEKLVALYLLTVADIRGTNPQIWNTWKAQLLETLFQAASRYLAGEHAPNRQHIALNRQKQSFELLKQNFSKSQIHQLWQALGEAYFVYYDDDEVAWQLPEILENLNDSHVQIRAKADHLHIMVYMPNSERLFTRICRVISQQGLDILAAKAMITAHDFVLDEFVVQLPDYCSSDDCVNIKHRLLKKLIEFTQGKQDIRSYTTKPSRRARHQPIAPRVSLTPDTERNHWYSLDIIAINRPALLADITEVFAKHQVRLYHAKIATLADRVEDAFVIYCENLDNPNKELTFKRDLLAMVNL